MFARSLMRWRGEVLVAASAAAAARNHDPLIRPGKVVHQLAGLIVKERSAHRHLQHQIFAFTPGAVRALAVPAALRFVLGIEPEVNQRIVALARLHDYVAAAPAIAARWAAARHK